jgi:hypothetical protein
MGLSPQWGQKVQAPQATADLSPAGLPVAPVVAPAAPATVQPQPPQSTPVSGYSPVASTQIPAAGTAPQTAQATPAAPSAVVGPSIGTAPLQDPFGHFDYGAMLRVAPNLAPAKIEEISKVEGVLG